MGQFFDNISDENHGWGGVYSIGELKKHKEFKFQTYNELKKSKKFLLNSIIIHSETEYYDYQVTHDGLEIYAIDGGSFRLEPINLEGMSFVSTYLDGF